MSRKLCLIHPDARDFEDIAERKEDEHYSLHRINIVGIKTIRKLRDSCSNLKRTCISTSRRDLVKTLLYQIERVLWVYSSNISIR
jgi:hypothetical protein